MSRSLDTFPLPPSQRLKLQKAGFLTVQDVLDVSPLELSKELQITRDEALELLQIVRGGVSTPAGSAAAQSAPPSLSQQPSSKSLSALEMLQQESTRGGIPTGAAQIDSMLGSGVSVGKITEFCGAPGIGKTQLGIQLAVNAQLPLEVGGLGGEAVYIDTEGSFIIERAEDIAEGGLRLAERLYREQHALPKDQPIPSSSAVAELSSIRLLSGIHYYRVHDYVEQLALINILPDFLQAHPKVRVVVVDSIAFHFRYHFDDMALRTRLLNGMSQSLLKLATDFSLAIVLINQMTTKIGTGSDRSKSHLIPALGESWGHASTNRVIMFWQNGVRYAMLYKSPSMQERTVPYQVTTEGIRDIPATTPASLARKRTYDEANGNDEG